jgi:hypothetical protein
MTVIASHVTNSPVPPHGRQTCVHQGTALSRCFWGPECISCNSLAFANPAQRPHRPISPYTAWVLDQHMPKRMPPEVLSYLQTERKKYGKLGGKTAAKKRTAERLARQGVQQDRQAEKKK